MVPIMANLVLYTPNYTTASGKRGQGKLQISAKHNFSYYKPYHYCAVLGSDNKSIGNGRDITESCAHEWLTRSRRAVMFADHSKLKPVKCKQRSFGAILSKLRDSLHEDHASCWVGSSGTCFILNEPYMFEQDYIKRLEANGLAGILLPVDISPYCGWWNTLIGALPRTHSFLICDISAKAELDAIARALSEANTPAWNSMEGISHV